LLRNRVWKNQLAPLSCEATRSPSKRALHSDATHLTRRRKSDVLRWLTRKRKSMKKLFVGNLPHSTTEAELRTLFEPHGKVDQVSLVTDRDTGRSRGFAFVEMADAAEAEKAIAALNGKELGGRALNINEARPKTDRGPGGPRGGGRPGGGGRSGGGGGGRDDYQGHARQPREPRW
jgi:cold-inducible RNA-binding protein